jgi:hypothetical protein
MITLCWAFRVLQWHASTLSAFCRLSSTARRAGSGASFSSAFVAECAWQANITATGVRRHESSLVVLNECGLGTVLAQHSRGQTWMSAARMLGSTPLRTLGLTNLSPALTPGAGCDRSGPTHCIRAGGPVPVHGLMQRTSGCCYDVVSWQVGDIVGVK